MGPCVRRDDVRKLGTAHPGMTKCEARLLPVLSQNLLAGLAQSGSVLLQTGQHGLVTVAHHRAAMTRDIAGAGVMALLLRRRRASHQHKRDHNENNPDNDVAPAGHGLVGF